MSAEQSTVEYREIPGHAGYRVGSDGSVWSHRRGEWRRLKDKRCKFGYARISIGRSHSYLVHRLVLTAFVGPCPNGMEARHGVNGNADNSVANLCWGTSVENASDRKRDGTHIFGERSSSSKLSEKDIADIKASYARGGITQATLACEHGVSKATIQLALAGKNWSHTSPLTNRPRNVARSPGERNGMARLTADDVRTIRDLFDSKEKTVWQLAKMYSYSFGSMRMLCKRKRWRHIT